MVGDKVTTYIIKAQVEKQGTGDEKEGYNQILGFACGI